MIIYDEGNLCIRNTSDEEYLCPRNHVYQRDVCGRGVVESENLRASPAVDVRTFYNLNETRIDENDRPTMIEGEGAILTIYRADTTRVSADNVTLDCSYHY